ncbi:MAG TPA: serine hydrolase [Chloroflexia bacterium]|nr:serine hydrolase [Chloroflexia bacterium]
MGTFEKSTPEKQGISSEAILAFLNEAEQIPQALHSLTLLRHGQVVAEGWWSPYTPEEPHILFSLSKSFTSTAVGLAVSEGKLSVNDPVISFFPEYLPEVVSPELSNMQVRHLLSMSTGHAEDAMQVVEDGGANWVQRMLALPVEYEPGTHFLYNTGATYLLSAIVQKVTGQNLLDYLQPRLFTPLGIEKPSWEISPEGIVTGGFGLSLTTGQVARFGQLYLQKGVWQGERLLPAEWVEEATRRQVSNGSNPESDWEQGYGYQFWRCRNGAYRGDGAFGQYCVVMPEQDAVLVITSGVDDMQAVLNAVWKHLLPAMQEEPLPENPQAQQALAEKLGHLELAPVKGNATSPLGEMISGWYYKLEANPYGLTNFSFDFSGEGCLLTIEDESGKSGKSAISCGYGQWQRGRMRVNQQGERKLAASGAWTAEDTYTAHFYFLSPVEPVPLPRVVGAMPFGLTLTCRFNGERVAIDLKARPSFAPEMWKEVQGQAF